MQEAGSESCGDGERQAQAWARLGNIWRHRQAQDLGFPYTLTLFMGKEKGLVQSFELWSLLFIQYEFWTFL